MALKIVEVGKVKIRAYVDGSTTVSIMRSGRWERDAWFRTSDTLRGYLACLDKDLYDDAIVALDEAGRNW